MQSSRARIFISYSHRGNGPQWKAALLSALGVFQKHHLLDVWQDGKIRVSSFWDDEIRLAMTNASLAVVLLTPDAIDPRSEADPNYILDTEFPLLRDRQHHHGLPVFPVVCEACDWRAHDWLRATQAPNESKRLSDLPAEAQASVFRKLATTIAEELSRGALAQLVPSDQALAPARVYLDKFPVLSGPGLREAKLIGREQELALLDLTFAQPHTAIVSIVAWGGVGKTMLIQYWLQRLERGGWFGARRIYAWSFYSQGTKEDRQASEDMFLSHALDWFGVKCEPTLHPYEKGRLLADAVARERTLLILDGIEPLQYPPGPMGGQLRAHGVQSLLKQLARKSNKDENLGLCLVTTREPLTDLNDFQRREGSTWGSVLRVNLGNLTSDAGAALLHHAGANRAGAADILSDDKELLAASREVDGHALTLNLLGRFLARAHGGDIRRRDLVKFEEADRKEQGGTTFKMLAAFENWFANEGDIEARALSVLRLLGLFDRPADSGCLDALRQPPVIAGLTDPLFILKRESNADQASERPLSDKTWNDATHFLADFGLVMTQADPNDIAPVLDCHPLIREHFAKQFQGSYPSNWQAAHHRLYQYLCATTPDNPYPTLEELRPLYQAVAHGCQAGCEDQSLLLFDNRILRREEYYSSRKLGALGDNLAALVRFFEIPWSLPIRRLNENSQAWLLNETALYLRGTGRLKEAIEAQRAGKELRVAQEDWKESAIHTNNLSELELMIGEVDLAVRDAEESVTHANNSGLAFWKMTTRTTYADALHQSGHRIEAELRFREAEIFHAQNVPQYPLLQSVAGFDYCEILLMSPECAAWRTILRLNMQSSEIETAITSCRTVYKRGANTLQWMEVWPDASLLTVSLNHLSLSRAALYQAILENSQPESLNFGLSRVTRAVDGFRHAGAQDHLPRGLLTRAWVHYLKAGTIGAQADLDEAWDIAERGPMRLHMADIHLYRARLFFRETHYPWKSPQDDLAAAEKLINECGYHRRDEELADAKHVILGT